jgi:hypothetical protein
MKIELRNRRGHVVGVALIDDQDAHLAKKPWYLLRGGYAVRTEIKDGKKRMLYLHREVMGMHPGGRTVVDHKDRNRLDCRRRNLRVVRQATNSSNRGANRARRLPRNVYPGKNGVGFRVQMKVNGRSVHVGTYPSIEEAGDVAIQARIANGVASVADLAQAKAVLDRHHGDGS